MENEKWVQWFRGQGGRVLYMVTEIVKIERQQLVLGMEGVKQRFLRNAIIANDRFCCYIPNAGWLS